MKRQDDAYYQAMLARDYRFDGKFFVGVKTTGIYCRPICPARPRRENVEFFTDARAAEKAGYRPCMRCRPECAPASPAWMGRSALVQRALRLIAKSGWIDVSEEEFADQLGVSARHLRRLFEQELGKTPKQVSDSGRLDFSRKLVSETDLPITEIAFTAGFASIRRFNAAFKGRFHRAPSMLRKSKKVAASGIRLTLPYRPPFQWDALIQFYVAHEIAGVESTNADGYSRVFRIDDTVGGLEVRHCAERSALVLEVVISDPRCLYQVCQRVRQMFDLDSDPLLIAQSFSSCRVLSSLCDKHPGLRIPRGFDPFETAISSILGQLVSTEQARRLVRQLVEGYGEQITNPLTGEQAFLFPTAKVLAKESLSKIGTTGARKDTLRTFSRLILEEKLSLQPCQDPGSFRDALLNIKGIGPWTAEYISLRALGDTDAFPGTDLILKRALAAEPLIQLEPLSPWRGYAAIYLWKEYAQELSKKGKGARREVLQENG